MIGWTGYAPSEMNAKIITYWIVTVLISAMMLLSAYMYLSGAPKMVEAFHALGYPDYFRVMLGVAKVLGVAVLLAPGLRVPKEWAYAGFAITFVAAVVSHLECGQGPATIAPVVASLLLIASYYLRPMDRRIVESPLS